MTQALRRPWRIVHSESEIGWGGQERRILSELVGFQRRGCEVSLLAAPHSRIYERAGGAGFPLQPLNVARLRFPITVLETARWLRRRRPDVLNTHSSRDGWCVGLAGRLAGVPLIVRTRHFDAAIRNRWLSRRAYTTLADHVMTTSRKITDHFQQLFHLPPDRVSTVSTGIDVDLFSPSGPRTSLWPGEDHPEWPVIGMVSVLRRGKGHQTFLEAARSLHDAGLNAHFVIVGEGMSRPMVEQHVSESGVGGYVKLLGHREDVHSVLRSLAVMIIPSLHEGIPQVGLQALACQTPVVGSNVGGIPEIIRPGETGRLFPAGEAAALASAVRATLENPAATRAMTERGRAMVVATHSLEVMLNKLDALYHRYLLKSATSGEPGGLKS